MSKADKPQRPIKEEKDEYTKNKREHRDFSVTEAKLEAALREIDNLKCDVKNLQIKKEKQFSEIQKLQHIKGDNLAFSRELQNANQIIKEKDYQISRLREERSYNEKCGELLVVLQSKLAKVYKEKIYYESQDAKKSKKIKSLNESLSTLRENIASLEKSQADKTKNGDDVQKIYYGTGADSNVTLIQAIPFEEFVDAKRKIKELSHQNCLLQKELLRLNIENGVKTLADIM